MSEENKKGFIVQILEGLANYQIAIYHTVIILIGLSVLIVVGYLIATSGATLKDLGKAEIARGLITVLVSTVIIAIALILVISVLIGNADEFEKKFQLGKEVLTVFVGILGTIMGFYYAQSNAEKAQDNTEKIIEKIVPTASPTNNSIIEKESQAFEALIGKDYELSTKLFSEAYKIYPTWRNIDEINRILTFYKEEFTKVENKPTIWKKIYCEIAEKQKTYGMSKEVLKKFNEEVNKLQCSVQ